MQGWRFWIDRGGTFTDVVARAPDGAFRTAKLLSVNPGRYDDAAVAGVREILEICADAAPPAGLIEHIKMGTTVATNALLERKGARTLFVTNLGFGDLLHIGHQARPKLFDLAIVKTAPLHDRVAEVSGRVGAGGRTLVDLDEDACRRMLERAHADGLEACAIALIHAWKYKEMEAQLAMWARDAGFTQVSVGHEASPLVGLVARASTTVADAYLSPVLRRYVDTVAGALGEDDLYFMQSNGGLARASAFCGRDAILSGPAGGVVGAARTAEAAGVSRIIGFDMGGTSTDVCLYAGAFERVLNTEVAGVPVRAPMMAIHTVAAGGGSILSFDGARYRAGPESAGADPGPACYRRGGPLTVTDANVMTGRILPEHFPAIFGPGADSPLDADVVREAFGRLAGEIAEQTGAPVDPREVADGFLRIAVANMAQAIRQVSLEKGHDVADFTLQCFGGAGGQHACRVADELGMDAVLIHPFAGILSAYGMGLADQSQMRQQAVERPLDDLAVGAAHALALELANEAEAALAGGDGQADVQRRLAADLRYDGTDTGLSVPLGSRAEMAAAFNTAHASRFGFATPERALVLESVSAEAIAPGEAVALPDWPASTGDAPAPIGEAAIWCEGAECAAPVYRRDALKAGDEIAGPAIISETTATTVVEPGWSARVGTAGELHLGREMSRRTRTPDAEAPADPVWLELFNNMFMALAERMGVVLRNTSTSVNIKERLDFSCALFDAEGDLIANAPHVPVHLGAMGESVRAVLASRRGTLKPGDMIALNNPFNGGTHLPDVTVLAPVFDESGTDLLFFVGNRGHHTDIGGMTPGSTPPNSTTLAEEGVVIDDLLVMDGGEFREQALRDLLASGPWPARNPDANVSDIKAQIAANACGIREAVALVARYGWPGVAAYMRHVKDNAEESVRRVIGRLSDGAFDYPFDDGSHLRVNVTVDHARREAVIDFSGTDRQRPGNFNAPPAVTRAAVLYVFRCLVDDDLPLNEGCFRPLKIVTPEGSFLAPEPGSAVVAGNTEISQAICDALFGALGACAASQGTMNNLLLGNARLQYYETIGGGGGAGPGFDGASGVHTHMTNTRITDPEILEQRYPMRLDAFALRSWSGGAGGHSGGDGLVRRITALEPMTVSVVSSRRVTAPFGLDGGAAGACGRQWIEHADGSREPLGAVAQAELAAGDAVIVETPGGGGFGAARNG